MEISYVVVIDILRGKILSFMYIKKLAKVV